MKNLMKCNVTIMVSNMDSAVDFYTKTLGLALKTRYDNHYAEILAGNIMLGLHPKDDSAVTGNNMSIGFGVTNFEETKEFLEGNGLELQIKKDGWSTIAHFSDPDGNLLYMVEIK